MSCYLPSEIWEEIFHRLPLKSLIKCISVCKAWKSLIIDQSFIHSHFSYTGANNHNESLFLHLSHSKKVAPGDYDTGEFHSLYSEADRLAHLSIFKSPFILECKYYLTVVGSCNGLVCYAGYSELQGINIIIMNPSIRKYIVLPKPTITLIEGKPCVRNFVRLGFGYDSRNKDFKVIRIVVCHKEPKKPLPPEVEIYSLATGKWRNITHRTLPGATYEYDCLGLVFVNGALHWVVYGNRHGQRHRHFILTFDLVEETFGELMLPKSWDDSSFRRFLLNGSDSLALVLHKQSNFHQSTFYVRVMKEYGVADSWNLVFSFDSTFYGGVSRVILALKSSTEVVIEGNKSQLFIVDLKKNLVKHLGLKEFFDVDVVSVDVDFCGHHVESLFLIDKKNNVVTF